MEEHPPNLLFIMADQLGRNHCGYAGAAKARTPHLDAFARQGVDFTNAVASSPVCATFRASLFTGKYTTSTGMVINELRMNPRHECLGHVVSRAGYQTCYIGKWHLYANELGNHLDPKNSFVPPGPHRLGFDGHWEAYNFHHENYGSYYHLNSPRKMHYPEGAYEPDAQTDRMIAWLERSRKPSAPFCAFLSYGVPHDPWTDDNVPEEWRRLFRETAFPHPPNYGEENDPYADSWGRLSPQDRSHLEAWRRNYYAMVANLDWNFGRLMSALDALDIARDTIVVFASDHGEMFGAHGRRAKNIFYEEAARIPFLIRWPGRIPDASKTDACISTVDVMPSLLGLMGLPIPAAVEGMDCSHCARGEDGPKPEAAFLQNTGTCAIWEDGYEWRALRDISHTYAIYRKDRSELLFDNQNDPYQMCNLSQNPASQKALDRYRKMLDKKMESINDTFESCTWYRDHWTKDRIILRTATMDAGASS